VTAPEPDVLPHVERPTGDLDGAQVGREPLDQVPPPLPVDRSCPDVDLGVLGRIGGPRPRPTPPMVVAVEVQDDERPAARARPGQHGTQLTVKPVVEPE
jgi:hypothetical protein